VGVGGGGGGGGGGLAGAASGGPLGAGQFSIMDKRFSRLLVHRGDSCAWENP